MKNIHRNKLKIGFVLDDSLDQTDGVQQYILTLGQRFKHLGHEVHFLVGHTSRNDIANVHSLSKNLRVNFNHNSLSTPLPVPRSKIKRLLTDSKFDILHVQLPYSPLLAGRVINLAPASTLVVGTFHIYPYSVFVAKMTGVLAKIAKKSLRNIDLLLSVSKPARDFAFESIGMNSHVLPNVVNTRRFKGAKPLKSFDDGKINIVYLGRLVARKGCFQFLKAITILHQRKQLAGTRVIIAGKGKLRLKIENYIKKYNLEDFVHVVGYVSEDIKPNLLASADITVFPSIGGESFGIVLIEAMASGRSVIIAGDNIGYASVLKSCKKQLIDPMKAKKFADRLFYFISNEKARQEAIERQSSQIGQYDVNLVGEKLLKYYQNALINKQRVR